MAEGEQEESAVSTETKAADRQVHPPVGVRWCDSPDQPAAGAGAGGLDSVSEALRGPLEGHGQPSRGWLCNTGSGGSGSLWIGLAYPRKRVQG